MQDLPTIPTDLLEPRAGEYVPAARREDIREAYDAVEREQFSDPDDRERYAEILRLIRSQIQDDVQGDRPQRMGAGGGIRVLPHDPNALEEFMTEREHGIQSGRKRRPLIREKTAREQWEDELVAAGLAPILDELTVAQRDAVRFVWSDGLTQREAAERLGVKRPAIQDRLRGSYSKIQELIPESAYRKVRDWLLAKGTAAGITPSERRQDLQPDSQRPTLTGQHAAIVETGLDALGALIEHHCGPGCHIETSHAMAKASSVRVIDPGNASVRLDPRRTLAVRLAYEVPA